MMSSYRSVFALLASYSILLLGNGLFNTVISLRSRFEGFSDNAVGLVLAGYYLGMLLSAFYSSKVIAILGHVRAFAIFASVASTVALVHLLWSNALFWGLLRLCSGFCMGAMIIVTEGWLNDKASNKNRGSIMSLYMIVTYCCAGVAQLIMMVGSPEGFKLFVIVSVLYSFALLPVLLSNTRAPDIGSPKMPNLKNLLDVSPVGMIGAFVVGFINSVFYSYSPVYAKVIGLNIDQIAIFVGLGISSGMILQFPFGKLSDVIDRRWVILISSTTTAIICFIFFNSHNLSSGRLYFMAILYGAFAFSINPICIAHTNDLTAKNERTQTSSGLLMMFGIGAVIGPILAGFVINHTSVSYIFLMSSIMTGVFAIYCLSRIVRVQRPELAKIKFSLSSYQSLINRPLFIRSYRPTKSKAKETKNVYDDLN